MTKINTGKFVTPDEMKFVTQLFGVAMSEPDPDKKERLNNYMKMLAMRYEYDFDTHELAPNGEIIQNCPECDDELKDEDVEIEE